MGGYTPSKNKANENKVNFSFQCFLDFGVIDQERCSLRARGVGNPPGSFFVWFTPHHNLWIRCVHPLFHITNQRFREVGSEAQVYVALKPSCLHNSKQRSCLCSYLSPSSHQHCPPKPPWQSWLGLSTSTCALLIFSIPTPHTLFFP